MSNGKVREIRATIGFTNPAVEAAVHYGKNSHKGELSFVDHSVDVTDARTLGQAPSLDAEGFELIRHESRVRNFRDRAEVQSVYRDEMAALIRERTGAARVVVFHMHIRDNSKSAHEDIRRPAAVPHVDYDENSFRIRAAEQLGGAAEAWLSRPFVALNIWRGIAPVEEMPLALCDGRSVAPTDFRKTIIHEKPGEPTPYAGMPLTYNPNQLWYYFPDMQPGEALLFKQCDSDHGKTQWSPHVAIHDPGSKPDARPRVSFEARTIAFF